MIKYDLKGVDNQFNVKGGQKACIPISIVTIHDLYKRWLNNLSFLMEASQWMNLIERAIILYDVWYESKPNHTDDNEFPTLDEVLAIEECKEAMASLFDEKNVTCIHGLIKQDPFISASSLAHVFDEMKRIGDTNKKVVCALIVIPVSICISILYYPYHNNTSKLTPSFVMFDSHGGGGGRDAKYCDFSGFANQSVLTNYIIEKYKLQDTLSELDPLIRVNYDEMELYAYYTFEAKLFY